MAGRDLRKAREAIVAQVVSRYCCAIRASLLRTYRAPATYGKPLLRRPARLRTQPSPFTESSAPRR